VRTLSLAAANKPEASFILEVLTNSQKAVNLQTFFFPPPLSPCAVCICVLCMHVLERVYVLECVCMCSVCYIIYLRVCVYVCMCMYVCVCGCKSNLAFSLDMDGRLFGSSPQQHLMMSWSSLGQKA